MTAYLVAIRNAYCVTEGECTATNTATTAPLTRHIGQSCFACHSTIRWTEICSASIRYHSCSSNNLALHMDTQPFPWPFPGEPGLAGFLWFSSSTCSTVNLWGQTGCPLHCPSVSNTEWNHTILHCRKTFTGWNSVSWCRGRRRWNRNSRPICIPVLRLNKSN